MSRYRRGPKLNGLGLGRQWASPEAHGGRGAVGCSPFPICLQLGHHSPRCVLPCVSLERTWGWVALARLPGPRQ